VIQRLLPFGTLAVLFAALAIASPHFLTGPISPRWSGKPL